MLLVATGEAHVVDGHLVDGEHGAGGAVLRGHVADGGSSLERQGGHARPVTLDEGTHHAVVPQQLGHGEDDVGGGGARVEFSGNAQADHRGEEHGERLAQHGRLGLNAADAPAQDAETVDHGGVGVGADQ